jgi:hypothetical protein
MLSVSLRGGCRHFAQQVAPKLCCTSTHFKGMSGGGALRRSRFRLDHHVPEIEHRLLAHLQQSFLRAVEIGD